MKIFIKALITTILVFVLSGPAFAYGDEDQDELRCNPTNGRWSYESSESTLKPNPVTGQWTHEDSESTLKCNPVDGTWEYVN